MTIARQVASQVAKPVARQVVKSAGGVSAPIDSLMFVSFGESNSGGYALNSDAQAWEIGSRSELQMWHVTNDVFENLDIGTNNNLSHAGLNSTTHGWELGLANRIRQGYFSELECHYVQTGQGASTIAQWAVGNGSGYWTAFLDRVGGAKAALATAGKVYSPVVWVSLGINDAIAGSPLSQAAYKAGMEELIERIKVELPNAKFYIATLPAVNATYTSYSTAITEIAATDASVTAIDVVSPVALPMRDTNHWSYLGMRRLAGRFVDAMLSDFASNMVDKSLDWSTRGDGGFIYTTASGQHSHVTPEIDSATLDLRMNLGVSTSGDGLVIAVDTDVNEVNWAAGSDSYLAGAYALSTTTFRTVANGSANSLGTLGNRWVRFQASGNDIVMSTSTDGGVNWTVAHTFTGALTSLSTVRVKSLSAVGAAYIDIWQG